MYMQGIEVNRIEIETKLNSAVEQNMMLMETISDQQNQLKDLRLQLVETKREKSFVLSKLKFMENDSGIVSVLDSDKDSRQFSSESGCEEKFDNAYLNDLKMGVQFEDVLNSAVLQERNSRVPRHLRDTYVVSAIDRDLTEDEIKVNKNH